MSTPTGSSRVYNAAASGAKGLHYYYDNLFGKPAATENFIRTAAQFQQRKPIVDIAVYYPNTTLKLADKADEYIYGFFHRCRPLRDRFDFNYVSDQMIRDGGLDRYKALVLLQGEEFEPDVVQRIVAWESRGGTLILPGNLAQSVTVLDSPDATAKVRQDWKKNAGPDVSLQTTDDSEFCAFVTTELISANRFHREHWQC